MSFGGYMGSEEGVVYGEFFFRWEFYAFFRGLFFFVYGYEVGIW